MATVEAYRKLVVARAGGACEYCRLLQDATGVTFHLEHVLPRSSGGETVLANLALSCPACNMAKAKRVRGTDAAGVEHDLFNPRAYDPWLLGWHLHFMLERKTGRIIARTRIGEATVFALKMNSRSRAFARKLQIEAGLIA
ncbi:MAG TPA: HNH endonuclease signature motif containing protein [Lacipirellulaceae bacterium]|nr:HNH endonuclease signature motif containing protein [Lacipirellulaceae bacterium]